LVLKEINNIVIIGSGNVATHLALAFQENGIHILQIFSRNIENAKNLAIKVGAAYTNVSLEIQDNADLYLFAVSDSAVISILQSYNWQNKLLAHTAGSLPIDIFQPFSENYGVFYPLQSFTKGRNFELKKVPFLIEGNNTTSEEILLRFAKKVSKKTICMKSEQRTAIHLAAVFASNFSNHMYSIASEILSKNNIPFNILNSLIEETTNKAIQTSPITAQTGPARRNNTEILQKHIDMLASEPDWQKIYTFASESIINFYKEKDDKF